MINITNVQMIDTKEAIKQIIFAPTKTECMGEERDIEVMEAVTGSKLGEFWKFNPEGILGAEKVKNASHLWCDLNHNIWQICCGRAKDMNDNDIPDCWYVRVVGTWFDF